MKKFGLITKVALCSVVAVNCYAADFFVKPSGSDSNDCLSWDEACATISAAISKAADDNGDVIKLAKGVYKPASTVVIAKTIDIVGGFTEGEALPKAGAGLTIISGDIDNDDMVDGLGITTSFSSIDGPYLAADNPNSGNTNQAFNISNSDVTFKNITITGFKGSHNSDLHGSAIFSANSDGGKHKITLVNVDVIGNRNYSMGNVMAYAAGAGSYVKLITENTKFLSNFGDSGAAIALHLNSDAEIKGAVFKNNVARSGSGFWDNGKAVVWAQNSSSISLENCLFAGNDTISAGAIAIDKQASIINCTFANNVTAGNGGAALFGPAAVGDITYSTFYGNTAVNGGAIRVDNTVSSAVKLRTSLLLGNSVAGVGANLSGANDSYNDDGYNLIGHSSISGIENTAINLILSSFTPTEALADIIDLSLANNGGSLESLALRSTSPARDVIPNDSVPFYGVGRSVDYPFTSLAQAHGALKSFSNYTAGIYYFDLGGSYANAASNFAFTPGALAGVFSTYINDEGWVLIASSNVNEAILAPYASTQNLTLASDKILTPSILSNANFEFEEVKIATKMDILDPLDIRSDSIAVINAIKNNQMLPNNNSNENWVAVIGDNHINSTSCENNNGTLVSLSESIYHSCGNAEGVVWSPAIYGETQDWSAGPYGDNMNLWVRSANALCNGAITTTDSRGLPRSDYLNPNDSGQAGEVHHCDVGAFEYNNGYRYDCYSEDGQRPENYVDFNAGSQSGSGSHQGCLGGDIFNATPKALLDSYGSIHYFYLLLLSGLFYLRRRF